jgi:hypothetical protein
MRFTLPVCLLLAALVLIAPTAPPPAAADAQPALSKAEKVVLALLGMVGSEEPAKVARGRRLMALQPETAKLRPLSLALTCEPASLRVYAAGQLARLEDGRAVRPLLARVLREREDRVRRSLVAALRERASPDAVHVLGKALGSRYAPTRCRAAEALGLLGDELGLGYLVRKWEGRSGDFPRVYFTQVHQVSFVQDFDVEVASTSFIADPLLGVAQQGFSHPVKIIGTEQVITTRERAAWRGALKALAGRDLGPRVEAWRRHWDANRDRLLRERAARLSP